MTREKAVALTALATYVLVLWAIVEVQSWRTRRRLRRRARPLEVPPTKAWLYGPYDQERAA